MAAAQTQRRLNIVVDGNVALAPYWPKIVSEYLEKIVRSFCDNSQEPGNNTIYEFGLVLYASNSDLGYCIQFINWTEDVDFFLGRLPGLMLNGDDSNQLVMTKGLAEALLMFLEPTSYKGEKHCVSVVLGEPIPRKTLVFVPVIQEGQLCGTQREARNVDIFEVVQMFALLDISFSVITPTVHPIFRAIFNLGNNVTEVEYDLSGDRTGEFTVLLSRNFKEAREVLHKNIPEGSSRNRSVESITVATNVALPNVSAGDLPVSDGLCSAAMTTTTGEQTIERAKAVRPVHVAVPNATPQTHEASSSAHTSVKVLDDMMTELINAKDDDVVLSTARPRTSIPLEVFTFEDLFQPNQRIPFDHSRNSHGQQQTMSSKTKVSAQDLRAVEAEFEQALMGTNELDTSKDKASNKNSSTQVTSSPLAVPISAPSPSTGIGSTTLVVESRSGIGVENPIPSSGHCSNSSHVPQTSTVAGPQARQGEVHQPSGEISTVSGVRLGINVEPLETQTSAGFARGDSLFPNAPGNTMIQCGASSSAPQQRVNFIQFQPSSSESPQMFPGTSSSKFSSNHAAGNLSIIQFESSSSAPHQTVHFASTQFAAMGNSSVIQFEASSSPAHQNFLGASTQFESHNAIGNTSIIQFEPSSSALPHQTFLGAGTQFASHYAMGNSSVIQFEPSSSAPQQNYLGASTQFASHNAVGNTSLIQFEASSSTPHQCFLGANTQFASHNAMGNSSSNQFEAFSSGPHQNFPNASTQITTHHLPGNLSVIQFQPSSSASPQMFPHGQFAGGPSERFSALQVQQHDPGYQHQRKLVTNFGQSHTEGGSSTCVPPVPSIPQIYDPRYLLSCHSSFVDFNEYVHTWEGSLVGSIYSHGMSFYRAKAFRKTTAPLTLTVQWKTKLLISHYISQKAVEQTKSLMKSNPDSVFFHILEFNNLDLYHHLVTRDVYAKIDLPSQALILSPTENVLFYLGTVFPGDTFFVEPA